MNTSQKGIEFLLAEEGFSPTAYSDGGFFSIGYGHQIQPYENYLLNSHLSETQARDIFTNDLKAREQAVNNLVSITLQQNQFDALVSLVYNIGIGNFAGSSVLKSINTGAGQDTIKTDWKKWNKSQGSILDVLVNRRERELAMYFQDIYLTKTKLNLVGYGIIVLFAGLITFIIYRIFDHEN